MQTTLYSIRESFPHSEYIFYIQAHTSLSILEQLHKEKTFSIQYCIVYIYINWRVSSTIKGWTEETMEWLYSNTIATAIAIAEQHHCTSMSFSFWTVWAIEMKFRLLYWVVVLENIILPVQLVRSISANSVVELGLWTKTVQTKCQPKITLTKFSHHDSTNNMTAYLYVLYFSIIKATYHIDQLVFERFHFILVFLYSCKLVKISILNQTNAHRRG